MTRLYAIEFAIRRIRELLAFTRIFLLANCFISNTRLEFGERKMQNISKSHSLSPQ